MKHNYNWVSILGKFEQKSSKIVFLGGSIDYKANSGLQVRSAIGNFLCNRRFSEGRISADIKFLDVDETSACEFILYYDVNTKVMLTAGIGGGGGMYGIRYFGKNQSGENEWSYIQVNGDRFHLVKGRSYSLSVSVEGSRIRLSMDGVEVCYADFHMNLPSAHIGLWCMGLSNIEIENYAVKSIRPKAFVVMQFSHTYNELYKDVILPVCEEYGYEVVRADELYGPGLIIADIVRQIRDSQLVLAEVTPENQNVYYELGYAHAVNKPTIILTEKGAKLPFDISPFRALFYENSIGGKSKVENGLRLHLKALNPDN